MDNLETAREVTSLQPREPVAAEPVLDSEQLVQAEVHHELEHSLEHLEHHSDQGI